MRSHISPPFVHRRKRIEKAKKEAKKREKEERRREKKRKRAEEKAAKRAAKERKVRPAARPALRPACCTAGSLRAWGWRRGLAWRACELLWALLACGDARIRLPAAAPPRSRRQLPHHSTWFPRTHHGVRPAGRGEAL